MTLLTLSESFPWGRFEPLTVKLIRKNLTTKLSGHTYVRLYASMVSDRFDKLFCKVRVLTRKLNFGLSYIHYIVKEHHGGRLYDFILC